MSIQSPNVKSVRRAVCLLMGFLASAYAPAQEDVRPVVSYGETTANDVYVRSGPSTNHYPVAKLTAGQRVAVVGEQGDWYEILPPADTFSLIHEDYVDTADGKRGIVNGHNVLVRAGSSIPPWTDQKYARQLKLSKGAEVQILGRNPEGYLRIEPPRGATSWVSRSLVELVPDNLVRAETDAANPPVLSSADGTSTATPAPSLNNGSRGGSGGSASRSESNPQALVTQPTDGALDTADGASSVQQPASPLDLIPSDDAKASLKKLDKTLEQELKKPVLEREIKPLIENYRQASENFTDELARLYASARVKQVENLVEVIDALRRMRQLNEDIEAQRRRFLDERASASYRVLPVTRAGLDVQGELRTSALYPPGSTPRRYRLIEPGEGGKTVGYVEIPDDIALKVEDFLGRYVGVRASEKHMQAGAVDPVPVYVVREMTLLRPSDLTETRAKDDKS